MPNFSHTLNLMTRILLTYFLYYATNKKLFQIIFLRPLRKLVDFMPISLIVLPLTNTTSLGIRCHGVTTLFLTPGKFISCHKNSSKKLFSVLISKLPIWPHSRPSIDFDCTHFFLTCTEPLRKHF